MSHRSPIRTSQITSKKVLSDSVQTHRVTMEMVNYAKEVFNEATVSELANNISESAADCNRFCGTIIEMATKLDKKDGKPHKNIHNIIEYHIIPKLNQNTTKEMIQYVSVNEVFDNEKLRAILEDTSIINRVIANHNALSKRFNMDKIARETIKNKDIENGVMEMCSLIDTYDISKQARFNVAIESIDYYMKNAGCKESVLPTIVDYFLTNESVIDDNTYNTMQNLIKNSRLLSESEKTELSYFTESKGHNFETQVDKLAIKCKNKECTRFIVSAKKVSNEKDAAFYIKNAVDMADIYKEDSKHLITSVFTLPLMGKVSKAFVSYQYKFCNDKKNKDLNIEGAEFVDVVNDILDDDDDDMMVEATLLEFDLINEEYAGTLFDNGAFELTPANSKLGQFFFKRGVPYDQKTMPFIVKTPTATDLEKLYSEYALCVEGCSENSLKHMAYILYTDYKIKAPICMYMLKANTMNKTYNLKDSNAYNKYVTFLLIPVDTFKNPRDLIHAKKTLPRARFFNDVVDNNEFREYISGRHGYSKKIDWILDLYENQDKLKDQKIQDMLLGTRSGLVISIDKTDPYKKVTKKPTKTTKVMEFSELLESEDYADSEDVKEILKQFKAEQKKDMGTFKYYMGKIYRKSPESIIDGTPEILNIVRVVFILAPAAIPYIGPVISLVGVLVDRVLHMKINDKQTEALIRKLEAEMDKIDKEIEKHPEKKDDLVKYQKCIGQCVKKADAYREAYINTDELENRRGNRSSGGDDDDFDFDLDGDFDFGLESVIHTMDAISIIAESRSSISDRLSKWSNLFDQSIVNELTDVMKMAPRTIDAEQVLLSIKVKDNDRRSVNEAMALNTLIYSKLYSLRETPIPRNTIDDIATEAYVVQELNNMLNDLESYNLKFVTEASIVNKIKLTLQAAKGKVKELDTKQKSMWQNLDIAASGFTRNLEKSLTSDRREGVIKGSLIPSFSKCIKSGLLVAGLSIANPILGIITAMGMIGASKKLNDKERQLIYDEIDTELKVVEKEIEMANNDGDTKKYRMLLQYQKRLDREKQRIKYGLRVHGRDIPDSRPRKDY